MDQRLLQLQYRVEHEHSDGSWGQLVEDRSRDASANDPERSWALRRIFRCTTCGDVVTLTPGEETAPPDAE